LEDVVAIEPDNYGPASVPFVVVFIIKDKAVDAVAVDAVIAVVAPVFKKF